MIGDMLGLRFWGLRVLGFRGSRVQGLGDVINLFAA